MALGSAEGGGGQVRPYVGGLHGAAALRRQGRWRRNSCSARTLGTTALSCSAMETANTGVSWPLPLCGAKGHGAAALICGASVLGTTAASVDTL